MSREHGFSLKASEAGAGWHMRRRLFSDVVGGSVLLVVWMLLWCLFALGVAEPRSPL